PSPRVCAPYSTTRLPPAGLDGLSHTEQGRRPSPPARFLSRLLFLGANIKHSVPALIWRSQAGRGGQGRDSGPAIDLLYAVYERPPPVRLALLGLSEGRAAWVVMGSIPCSLSPPFLGSHPA